MRPSQPTRAESLRHRLLRLSLGVTLPIWAVAVWVSHLQASHEVHEMLDGQLVQSASLLLAQAIRAPEHLADIVAETSLARGAHDGYGELALEYQIRRRDGRVVARSPHGPAEDLRRQPLGFSDILHAGEPWRSLVLATPDGDYLIQAIQSSRQRDREAREIANKTVMPLGLFIPVLIGLIYLSVRRGLKPIDDLAAEVAVRSPERLDAVNATEAPAEAQPLVAAINRLFARLGASLDNERRFTADAAHELRTPLAAVRVQAQVALAAQDPTERRHALLQVLAGVERATRLVEQLLRLARLDPMQELPEPQPVDLVAIAHAAVQTHGLDRILLDAPHEAVVVSGDCELLNVALRNLLDNAIRYTPPHGRIVVFVQRRPDGVELGVADEGRGVAEEALPKLTERFYRGRDHMVEGSGLGLAIVRRIAELHGARLQLVNRPEGGLRASLLWTVAGNPEHHAAEEANPRIER